MGDIIQFRNHNIRALAIEYTERYLKTPEEALFWIGDQKEEFTDSEKKQFKKAVNEELKKRGYVSNA